MNQDEVMSQDEVAIEMAEMINQYGAEFDRLTQERHEAGKAAYGAITFLGNDVVRMMMEELADTSNYCRMQFIKLMFLQNFMEQNLDIPTDENGEQMVGFESFKGTKETGWTK